MREKKKDAMPDAKRDGYLIWVLDFETVLNA